MSKTEKNSVTVNKQLLYFLVVFNMDWYVFDICVLCQFSNNVKQKRNCLLIKAFVDIKFDIFLIIEVSFNVFGCQTKAQ